MEQMGFSARALENPELSQESDLTCSLAVGILDDIILQDTQKGRRSLLPLVGHPTNHASLEAFRETALPLSHTRRAPEIQRRTLNAINIHSSNTA